MSILNHILNHILWMLTMQLYLLMHDDPKRGTFQNKWALREAISFSSSREFLLWSNSWNRAISFCCFRNIKIIKVDKKQKFPISLFLLFLHSSSLLFIFFKRLFALLSDYVMLKQLQLMFHNLEFKSWWICSFIHLLDATGQSIQTLFLGYPFLSFSLEISSGLLSSIFSWFVF